MRSETAKDLLAEADRARSKARAGRRGAWFALVVFGALVLSAAPLYIAREVAVYPDGSSTWASGGWWVSLYWLIAVPLGYFVCVRHYRRHAERTGVAGAVWPWVAAGLGLFALMTLVPPGIVGGWIPAFAVGWTSLPLLALAGGSWSCPGWNATRTSRPSRSCWSCCPRCASGSTTCSSPGTASRGSGSRWSWRDSCSSVPEHSRGWRKGASVEWRSAAR